LSVDARLVLPGNVYNFSPDAGARIGEEAAQEPVTRKGKIRVEMEEMIASAGKLGLKSLIVRVGDFFGPHSSSSWFNEAMVSKGKPLTRVTYPGDPNIGHAWVYLPDLGETVAALLDQEQRLAQVDRFHMAGHYVDRGIEMAEATLRVAGLPKEKIKNLPWIAFYLLAPFVTFMREALEMRYLWKKPIGLNNAKLVAFLGAEPHTSLETAIRDTLVQLKCLPTPAAIQPATALTSGAKRSAATL
jgi:nucleoside-diphosphate-sugar epimerase